MNRVRSYTRLTALRYLLSPHRHRSLLTAYCSLLNHPTFSFFPEAAAR